MFPLISVKQKIQPKGEKIMFCKKCGKEIADKSTFCSVCGAKQVTIYTKEFDGNLLNETQLLDTINEWFAANPNVGNVSCHFEIKNTFGLLANNHKLKSFKIQYELFDRPNQYRYFIKTIRKIALVRMNNEKILEKWKSKNPQVTVVKWIGGSNSRGKMGNVIIGGLGAINRMSIFMCGKIKKQ